MLGQARLGLAWLGMARLGWDTEIGYGGRVLAC
jgi:hypothetical protein